MRLQVRRGRHDLESNWKARVRELTVGEGVPTIQYECRLPRLVGRRERGEPLAVKGGATPRRAQPQPQPWSRLERGRYNPAFDGTEGGEVRP